MAELSLNAGKKIRDKPWHINKQNLTFDKGIIEEIIKNLKLVKCPICRGELESKVNNYTNPEEFDEVKKYCPNQDYTITLRADRYGDHGGNITYLYLSVSQKGQLIAFSGQLAEIRKKVYLSKK